MKARPSALSSRGQGGSVGYLADLVAGWPDVLQEDRVALGVVPNGLGLKVDVAPASEGIGHHQGGRGEIVGPSEGMDPALEVAVPGEHRGGDDVGLLDGLVNRRRHELPAVADACHAAVARVVEPERVERGLSQGG